MDSFQFQGEINADGQRDSRKGQGYVGDCFHSIVVPVILGASADIGAS